MDNVPVLSVILCTYNNADSLAITLSQLALCKTADRSDVEILVIDNNSSDHTESVVRGALDKSPELVKYCFESKQGLSNARNHGLEKARGDYLLFTDDDADIPAHWIEAYLEQIRSSGADCLFSRIEVKWDRSPPWWFDQRYNSYFVHLNYGNESFWIKDIDHEFFGKNFCCRKNILESFGGFDESLGRLGASLAAGEETVIYRRLIEQGANVLYFPGAAVGHRLKPAEYTTDNIEKKFVDGASSSLRMANYFSTKRIFGRPAYPLKTALETTLKSTVALIVAILLAKEGSRRDTFYHVLQLKRSARMIKLWVTAS